MKNTELITRRVVRKLIGYVREQERHVAPEELDDLWRRVEEQVSIEKRKRSRRRVLHIATTVAAAAVLCCVYWLGHRLIPDGREDDSIVDFAQYAQAPEAVGEDIRLLMPGREEVDVKATDARIVHSQNGTVVVNSDTIGRRQPQQAEAEAEFCQLIIPKGRRTQLTLADGTRLWANSGTRVVYPVRFERHRREIYVEGEAFLEVSRREDAPFVVRTREFQVQVLGTTFNVSSYPSEGTSSVVLVEGSVNVKNRQEQQVRLAPGQLVDIETGRLHAPRTVDVEPYICWVKNMLMYMNEPLERVFRKLNLYYGREFVLEPGVAALQVSGKLDLKERLDDVLRAISFSAPIRYEEVEETIYVRKR